MRTGGGKNTTVGESTYQSWNCASDKPSLGCIVTYKMPGVDFAAMMGEVG